MSETLKTCAHYDDDADCCLFSERQWSPACRPKQCKDCPMTMTTESRDALVEQLAEVLWDNNWQVQHLKRDGVPLGPIPWYQAVSEGWAGVAWSRMQADAILPIIAAERAAVWEAAAAVADAVVSSAVDRRDEIADARDRGYAVSASAFAGPELTITVARNIAAAIRAKGAENAQP